MAVGFYPACDYQTLVEFGVVRIGGGPKSIVSDEQFEAMGEGLPRLRDAMCSRKPAGGSVCKGGAFRMNVT